MKKIPLIFFALLFGLFSKGQSIELEVISPNGDWLQGSSGMDLHCTLGEPVVEKFENGIILTQGFHQVFDFATPVHDLSESDFEIQVYPNPAVNWIKIETNATEILHLQLYDSNGRTMYETTLEFSEETLDVSKLPGGTYYLSVSTKHELIQTFIFQKVK